MSPQTVKKEKKKKAKKAKEAVETADQPGDEVCRAAPIGLPGTGRQAGLDRGGNSLAQTCPVQPLSACPTDC